MGAPGLHVGICQRSQSDDMEGELAEPGELSLLDRRFVRGYTWRRISPTPWHRLIKPLNECRLALISTAGFVLPVQVPFARHRRGGDPSFREIPSNVSPRALFLAHKSRAFDRSGLLSDPNLAFPLQRVRELADRGHIGSVNHRHLSFMGSITAPGRLMKTTAPSAIDKLVEDRVDIALLVPV